MHVEVNPMSHHLQQLWIHSPVSDIFHPPAAKPVLLHNQFKAHKQPSHYCTPSYGYEQRAQ